jgi:hypothetical protein
MVNSDYELLALSDIQDRLEKIERRLNELEDRVVHLALELNKLAIWKAEKERDNL